MVGHTCNPITEAIEARELEVQGYPGLPGKFKASLDYMCSCFKNKEEGPDKLSPGSQAEMVGKELVPEGQGAGWGSPLPPSLPLFISFLTQEFSWR